MNAGVRLSSVRCATVWRNGNCGLMNGVVMPASSIQTRPYPERTTVFSPGCQARPEEEPFVRQPEQLSGQAIAVDEEQLLSFRQRRQQPAGAPQLDQFLRLCPHRLRASQSHAPCFAQLLDRPCSRRAARGLKKEDRCVSFGCGEKGGQGTEEDRG